MSRRRRVRIAARWGVLFLVLAVGAGALLLLYGAALVDDAIHDSRVEECARVLSAPLVLRAGDSWSVAELAATLTARGVPRARGGPAGAGEFAADGERVVLGAGLVAGVGNQVTATGRGGRLRLAAGELGLREVAVRPAVIGARQSNGAVSWPVALDAMAPHLLTAVVDMEDKTFLTHPGLSARGMLRAAAHDLIAGGVQEGGSTITQQLAKILMLRPARTVSRKVLEAWLATLLEYRYDKRTILETYLNRIYLGQDRGVQIQGVAAAAHYYFGKRPGELREEEAALLAGLIAAPNRFDPFAHPQAARARREAVIDSMVRQHHLDADHARRLAARPLPDVPHHLRRDRVGQVVEAVLREGPAAEKIVTTVALEVQDAVFAGARDTLSRLEKRHARLRRLAASGDPLQVAVVVMRTDGRVVSMLGSRSGEAGEFNRASSARRQIGSLVKPFIVAIALGAGRSLDDPLIDAPISVPVGSELWRPENSDRTYRGEVTVRDALVLSLNVPTVRLGLDLSVDRVARVLRSLGFTVPPHAPAILLGAVEATPLEVAAAFTALLAGGRVATPSLVVGVPAPRGPKVLGAQACREVVEALRQVVQRGTAASLGPAYAGRLAAKTGTTDGRRDSWFVALRPDTVTVVWLGTDANGETGLFGATGAMQVWREIDRRLPARWR